MSARIEWYRTPLPAGKLSSLNQKSDLKAFAQALGHLGLLALSGGCVLYAPGHWRWWVLPPLLLLHGTIGAFMINAVHELVHKSVFKTQRLNEQFAQVFAFCGWIHHEHFWSSHRRHHQFTLHQPDDLEVVLPIKAIAKNFLKYGIINPLAIKYSVKNAWRLAHGRFEGEWETRLFPTDKPELARPIKRWAWTLLAGHASLLIVSLLLGVLVSPRWLLLPVLTSLLPCYGGLLQTLCNYTQHIGLQDQVPDFRLCCRTFTINPLVQFLYWHMNFHVEHHMYAAVPCYNLGQLHRAILYDLPPCPHGLVATWREIAAIQRLQVADPSYQYVPPLPQQLEPASQVA